MHWHRVLGEVVGPPDLEVFENHGDVARGDMVSGQRWWQVDSWTERS